MKTASTETTGRDAPARPLPGTPALSRSPDAVPSRPPVRNTVDWSRRRVKGEFWTDRASERKMTKAYTSPSIFRGATFDMTTKERTWHPHPSAGDVRDTGARGD
jgi:hypothetical protein